MLAWKHLGSLPQDYILNEETFVERAFSSFGLSVDGRVSI